MTQKDEQLKKKIQYAVVGAMTLFFVLVTVLAFQFAVRINQRSQEKNLFAAREQLQRQMEEVKSDINYFKDQKFIDDYVFKYNNWGSEGQQSFEK